MKKLFLLLIVLFSGCSSIISNRKMSSINGNKDLHIESHYISDFFLGFIKSEPRLVEKSPEIQKILLKKYLNRKYLIKMEIQLIAYFQTERSQKTTFSIQKGIFLDGYGGDTSKIVGASFFFENEYEFYVSTNYKSDVRKLKEWHKNGTFFLTFSFPYHDTKMIFDVPYDLYKFQPHFLDSVSHSRSYYFEHPK